MRAVLLTLTLVAAIAVAAFFVAPRVLPTEEPRIEGPLHDGDVVFQTTSSDQARAIQLATHSPYTHVGVVATANGKTVVLEASDHVRVTPLDEWLARAPGSFVAKRLKTARATFTPEAKKRFVDVGKRYIGRPYDDAFDWSDARMYCSELVWKVFHEALGVDLGQPQPLRTFDLTSKVVQAALERRYKKRVPLDEPTISPQQIFESDYLELVSDGPRHLVARDAPHDAPHDATAD